MASPPRPTRPRAVARRSARPGPRRRPSPPRRGLAAPRPAPRSRRRRPGPRCPRARRRRRPRCSGTPAACARLATPSAVLPNAVWASIRPSPVITRSARASLASKSVASMTRSTPGPQGERLEAVLDRRAGRTRRRRPRRRPGCRARAAGRALELVGPGLVARVEARSPGRVSRPSAVRRRRPRRSVRAAGSTRRRRPRVDASSPSLVVAERRRAGRARRPSWRCRRCRA